MSKKAPARPAWWKNTFFWFGFALLGLAIFGLISGENVIRDPGQKFETGLVGFYLLGAILMLVNGWMTHQQAVQFYAEFVERAGDADSSSDSNSEVNEE